MRGFEPGDKERLRMMVRNLSDQGKWMRMGKGNSGRKRNDREKHKGRKDRERIELCQERKWKS